MGVTIQHIGKPTTLASIGEWVKEQTIIVAERELAAQVGRGFDNQPVVVTDGMPRRDYTQVKPFGKIEFIARNNMADAVIWALNELWRRSPVKTGRYRAAHTVLIDDVEIGETLAPELTLRTVKEGQRVQIVNTQPYARRIEKANSNKKTGRGARSALSAKAKAGVYQPVLRALVRRYGKSMFFDFKYVKLNLGVKVWGRAGGRKDTLPARQIIRGAKGRITGMTRAGRNVQRDQVYPSLHFYIKPTGV